VSRYTFDEVQAAMTKYWGLRLGRGGKDDTDGKHDGRWDVSYSRTGFVVGGQFPGIGYTYRHYRSLRQIVKIFELEKPIKELRK
jgi:hypothetical protein